VTLFRGDGGFRAQGPVFAVALLVFIIAGGTAGYMAIEGWDAWDAFYMTIITVTTAGNIPIQSTQLRVRSTFVSGVGIFLTVAAILFLALWWGWDIRKRRRAKANANGGPHGGEGPHPVVAPAPA
jgi:hypothetical protein